MTSQIILESIEDIQEFARMISTIYGAVNVRTLDRSHTYDAKSILSIMLLGSGRPFEIELISNEVGDIERFKLIAERFSD